MQNQKNNKTAEIEQLANGEFKISGTLDFSTVPSILLKSQSLFASTDSIKIDFSAVEHSNSAGLALLIEWMRSAKTNDKQIIFQHLPVQMQEIARVCGVESNLPG